MAAEEGGLIPGMPLHWRHAACVEPRTSQVIHSPATAFLRPSNPAGVISGRHHPGEPLKMLVVLQPSIGCHRLHAVVVSRAGAASQRLQPATRC
jgi:hypothetical protein